MAAAASPARFERAGGISGFARKISLCQQQMIQRLAQIGFAVGRVKFARGQQITHARIGRAFVQRCFGMAHRTRPKCHDAQPVFTDADAINRCE